MLTQLLTPLVRTQATRVAAEGLVGVVTGAHAAVLVELNSETDFVARNPKFQVQCATVRMLQANALV